MRWSQVLVSVSDRARDAPFDEAKKRGDEDGKRRKHKHRIPLQSRNEYSSNSPVHSIVPSITHAMPVWQRHRQHTNSRNWGIGEGQTKRGSREKPRLKSVEYGLGKLKIC